MHATGQDLVRVLRAAGRAAVDYALPPRCPACGAIVGSDRQFCLACWSSLDFLDGPACARCSISLPHAVPDGALQCGACLADPAAFEGGLAAVAAGTPARTAARSEQRGLGKECGR